MKVSIEISTGKLIEMQSNPSVGTLLRNAIAAGYDPLEIEEREVTDLQFKALIESNKSQLEKDEEEVARLIAGKKDELAIKDLKKDGKLNPDGTLKK